MHSLREWSKTGRGDFPLWLAHLKIIKIHRHRFAAETDRHQADIPGWKIRIGHLGEKRAVCVEPDGIPHAFGFEVVHLRGIFYRIRLRPIQQKIVIPAGGFLDAVVAISRDEQGIPHAVIPLQVAPAKKAVAAIRRGTLHLGGIHLHRNIPKGHVWLAPHEVGIAEGGNLVFAIRDIDRAGIPGADLPARIRIAEIFRMRQGPGGIQTSVTWGTGVGMEA